MFTSHLIYKAFGNELKETNDLCCFCGFPYGKVERKKIIKPTFTNLDILKVPGSNLICNACEFVISDPQFRRTSFICNQKFIPLKREEIADKLFNSKIDVPFVIAITTSYKKHIWIHAQVNTNDSNFSIAYDETLIQIDKMRDKETHSRIEILYSVFTKEEIRTEKYNTKKLLECNLDNFIQLDYQIDEFRYSLLFDFLLFITNKKEDLCNQILLPESQRKDAKR